MCCVCVCVWERDKIGGGGREWGREKAIVVVMIPSGLEGRAEYAEGWGESESECGRFTVGTENTGLAYGEWSWLSEHAHKQARFNQPRQLSFPFCVLCSLSSDNKLQRILSKVSVISRRISQTAESFKLWSEVQQVRAITRAFEVDKVPVGSVDRGCRGEKKGNDKVRTPSITLCLLQWVDIFLSLSRHWAV